MSIKSQMDAKRIAFLENQNTTLLSQVKSLTEELAEVKKDKGEVEKVDAKSAKVGMKTRKRSGFDTIMSDEAKDE